MIGTFSAQKVHGQRHDDVHHFRVAAEGFEKILTNTGNLCDLFQQPYITVKSVLILTFLSRASRFSPTGEFVDFTEVPVLREYQLLSFFNRSEEIFLSGVEFVVFINSAPMNLSMRTLSGFWICKRRLCSGVTITIGYMQRDSIGCILCRYYL